MNMNTYWTKREFIEKIDEKYRELFETGDEDEIKLNVGLIDRFAPAIFDHQARILAEEGIRFKNNLNMIYGIIAMWELRHDLKNRDKILDELFNPPPEEDTAFQPIEFLKDYIKGLDD